MALYGVQRMEKYKAKDIAGLQGEAQRTAKCYNNEVDLERIKDDIFLYRTENWHERIKELLQDKGVRVRKDSNLFIGGLYTASLDFFKQQENEAAEQARERTVNYFKDCLQWHIDQYCNGNTELMLSAVVHLDETTPHLQVYTVPLQERQGGRYGKWALSAKAILGTNRDYTDRVNCFHQTVAVKYGLERGEPSRDGEERKKHITAQQHKAEQARQELERHNRSLGAIGESLRKGNAAKLEESKRINSMYGDRYGDTVFVATAELIQEQYTEFWEDMQDTAEERLREKGILPLEEYISENADLWESAWELEP